MAAPQNTVASAPEGPPASRAIAVMTLQLGGPKTTDDIVPFLTELFADVLPLPGFLARALGGLIARRRLDEVQPLYEEIGGGSPLLGHTEAQCDALQKALRRHGLNADISIAMRYAPPRVEEALQKWRALPPDTPLVVLPLYPQYSFATTRSSVLELWPMLSAEEKKRTHVVSAYPEAKGYVRAMAEEIASLCPADAEQRAQTHLVFSAHGLPLALVRQGDPYPEHIEATKRAVLALLERKWGALPPNVLCFQSRVGPIKWLTPSTEDTLKRMGEEGVKKVVVIPIAFVSEHIETLHELDIQLRETAVEAGMTDYQRAPTVMVHEAFIEALAEQVAQALPRP